MMNGPENPDSAIVAMKPANKAGQPAAERVEPRAGTKGNTGQSHTRRTQSRGSVSQGLDRVRNAARQRKKEKFTALLHHVTVDLLREAFLALKRRAAPGVDGVTWQDYEANLEGQPPGPACDQNLFVTVQHHEVPWVPAEKSVEVEALGRDCWKIQVHFGFKNDTDVPKALQQLEGRGVELDEDRTSYFLSRDIVVPTVGGGTAPWREKLFANLHRNSSNAAEFLSLPSNRVVELGAQVAI